MLKDEVHYVFKNNANKILISRCKVSWKHEKNITTSDKPFNNRLGLNDLFFSIAGIMPVMACLRRAHSKAKLLLLRIVKVQGQWLNSAILF